jgi:hypothetical protein
MLMLGWLFTEKNVHNSDMQVANRVLMKNDKREFIFRKIFEAAVRTVVGSPVHAVEPSSGVTFSSDHVSSFSGLKKRTSTRDLSSHWTIVFPKNNSR